MCTRMSFVSLLCSHPLGHKRNRTCSILSQSEKAWVNRLECSQDHVLHLAPIDGRRTYQLCSTNKERDLDIGGQNPPTKAGSDSNQQPLQDSKDTVSPIVIARRT